MRENSNLALLLNKPLHRSRRGEEALFDFDRIIKGDALHVLKAVPAETVDPGFWSPQYYVGQSYEKDLAFAGWQSLDGGGYGRARHNSIGQGLCTQ